MISCSQFVHRFGQPNRDCSALPPNLKVDLYWPLGWVSHGECTSIYDCILDKTYRDSWCKVIDCCDSPMHYIALTFNFERIFSMCQNQHKALTYKWDHNVVIYSYQLGHCWCRLVATIFSIKAQWYFMKLRHCVPLGDLKDTWSSRLWS